MMDKKLKILHVNNVANVPATLVKGLTVSGIEAELYHPKTGGYTLGKVGKICLSFQRFGEILSLSKYIKREKFDIVHIHYAYFGLFGILGGYPYWLHCHGTDVRRNLYHPLFKHITVSSLKRAGKVFYSTPDLYEYVSKLRSDAIFLPNPIDTNLFSPVPNNTTGKRILIISRIDNEKGADKIFQAVKKIKEKHSEVEIAAFAWGRHLDTYKDAKVTFIARVEYAKMPTIINSFDIVIGQIELGSMGMSELETMACAKPVMCCFRYKKW